MVALAVSSHRSCRWSALRRVPPSLAPPCLGGGFMILGLESAFQQPTLALTCTAVDCSSPARLRIHARLENGDMNGSRPPSRPTSPPSPVTQARRELAYREEGVPDVQQLASRRYPCPASQKSLDIAFAAAAASPACRNCGAGNAHKSFGPLLHAAHPTGQCKNNACVVGRFRGSEKVD
jgi:hypothetical protein